IRMTTSNAYGTAEVAPAGDPIIQRTEFDPTYGAYPIKQTNPLGQSTSLDYDYTLGLPIRQTDANGVVTHVYYDNFGRLTQLVKPGNGDAKDSAPTFQVTYNPGLPFRVDLRQRI